MKPQQSLQQRVFTRESANNTFKRGRENNLIIAASKDEGEIKVIGAELFENELAEASIDEDAFERKDQLINQGLKTC